MKVHGLRNIHIKKNQSQWVCNCGAEGFVYQTLEGYNLATEAKKAWRRHVANMANRAALKGEKFDPDAEE